MAKDTWVVVADAAKATIYACDSRLRTAETLHSLVHSESRMRAQDLVSSDRGRGRHGAVGQRRGSGLEGSYSIEAIEADRFAHELAALARSGRVEGRLTGLVLVAPPKFLGQLKGVLDSDTASCVRGTVPKDYTRVEPPRVLEMIRDALEMV